MGGLLRLPGREGDAGVVEPAPDPDARQDDADIEVDARIVGMGLGIAAEDVEPARHAGTITTLCERGTGEDSGLVRVTFYLGKRRLRLLLDERGKVLQQHPPPDQPNT